MRGLRFNDKNKVITYIDNLYKTMQYLGILKKCEEIQSDKLTE